MKKEGKKLKNKNQISDKIVANNLEEAVAKIKELSETKKRKFTESVDLAINLGIDAKQSDQTVKGTVLPPHGLGKKVKVVVFATNDDQKKLALENGAIFAGLEDLAAKIEDGFVDFDCCIATPESMQKISKVAKKLGPRGLMPSPKNGTVTSDIKKAISDALKGKVNFKNDKAGTIHCSSGKVDFDSVQLIENIKSIVKAIKESKPEGAKGKFIKEIFLNTSMGPSIQVPTESI
jgi:large subunit ribosomal protein L1